MIQNWGFLLGEMWGLILLAALLGLLAGWIIWSKREEVVEGNGDADLIAQKDRRIAELEADLNTCNARVADLQSKPAPVAAAAVAAPLAAVPAVEEQEKPTTLDAPRGGKADDLKRIKGIGPQMEKLCNQLGFWHFDQIASWSDSELAWVDSNLASFKGRASRDNWVSQAKLLADGGETDFSKKVDKGGIY
ncbi:hypothetical protein [Nereida sp. MMG025]|uniref:hypothetical protein n=1 Tax=Nereida sp. MMG025 TaxID=2909981 RepID=UPI00351D5035